MYRNQKGGILLPVLILFLIIALVAAVGVYYLYQKEFAQNIKLQAQITELDNRQKETAGQLEEAKKSAAELELKLQEAKKRIDTLDGELAAEKTAHLETSDKLEQFIQDLTQQKSLREDLEGRLNQVQEDGKQIQEQIRIIQQQKMELEEKIKNLEAGAANVELGKVVVNPEVEQLTNDILMAQPKVATEEKAAEALPLPKVTKVTAKKEPVLFAKGQEGKVMIVNKEFNFVVINLGSKDKVSVGDTFEVSRAGKPMGDVKVEKVHEFMSAAGFAAELKEQIKENDKVTQKIR